LAQKYFFGQCNYFYQSIWKKLLRFLLFLILKAQFTPFFLFITFISLSGIGTKYFTSRCDIDSAIIFTTGRWPDVNLHKTGVGANDCKCSWDQQPRAIRSTEELKIINFGHPYDDWCLRTLLSFRDRPSSFSIVFNLLHEIWSIGIRTIFDSYQLLKSVY
jgi:hypothetical protein